MQAHIYRNLNSGMAQPIRSGSRILEFEAEMPKISVLVKCQKSNLVLNEIRIHLQKGREKFVTVNRK